VWFLVSSVLGLIEIAKAPSILLALSPLHAIDFSLRHGFAPSWRWEPSPWPSPAPRRSTPTWATSAAQPIRLAWLGLVLPSLLANYYGQGALLLADPTALENPFFRLAPVLDALSAGRARDRRDGDRLAGDHLRRLLDGAAGALLGLSPARQIEHTSASEFGQIYVPAINWMQLAGVVALVLSFKSSTNLAAAYGIAVTGTMLVTTLLVFVLAGARLAVELAAGHRGARLVHAVDATLFSANMVKFVQGGWVPLASPS
jgi:KUP system potassium uptake protein